MAEEQRQEVVEVIQALKEECTVKKNALSSLLAKTVRNPCYTYSRMAKEKFFNNFACSYLFLKAAPFIKEDLTTN